MKLSEAIEQMLVTKVYSLHMPYMCIVLGYEDNTSLHIKSVVEMVNGIYHNTGDIPLVCALHYRNLMNINDGSWSDARQFDYTQQLYCWWVFDLKRKGL